VGVNTNNNYLKINEKNYERLENKYKQLKIKYEK
jgi:hypothetical protein